MRRPSKEFDPGSKIHLLLPYVADLELDVDRLRKQGQFVQQEALKTGPFLFSHS